MLCSLILALDDFVIPTLAGPTHSEHGVKVLRRAYGEQVAAG